MWGRSDFFDTDIWSNLDDCRLYRAALLPRAVFRALEIATARGGTLVGRSDLPLLVASFLVKHLAEFRLAYPRVQLCVSGQAPQVSLSEERRISPYGRFVRKKRPVWCARWGICRSSCTQGGTIRTCIIPLPGSSSPTTPNSRRATAEEVDKRCKGGYCMRNRRPSFGDSTWRWRGRITVLCRRRRCGFPTSHIRRRPDFARYLDGRASRPASVTTSTGSHGVLAENRRRKFHLRNTQVKAGCPDYCFF